ncbi:MAG: EAL domain-containing protein [Pseudomonadota bacterium]|nr:EAL domain-containing protein [Pseudomonadota bacterium]
MNSKKLYSQLEKSIAQLREEKENKLSIIRAFHEAVIVFNSDLKPRIINDEAKTLFKDFLELDCFIEEVPFYRNKKATLKFHIKAWLDELIETPSEEEPKDINIWLKDPLTLKTTSLLLSAKALLSPKGKVNNLLVVVYDRSIHAEADTQKRLMESAFNSFDGQFITNEKGYITHPNDSFCALTGLNPQQLKTTTLTSWLDSQVRLKTSTNEVLTTLLESKHWSGEVELHPMPDTTFYAVLSLSMLLDDQRNIEHYVARVQNITDIHEAQMAIEQMAYYDDLTGLANRRLAVEHIDVAIKHHKRRNSHASIFLINIDRFKAVNDSFGRKTGDMLLQQIAINLKSLLREEDTVARINGDEFLVLTQDQATSKIKATQNAYHLAQKITKRLNKNYHLNEITIQSTICLGIAIFPFNEDDTAESLIIHANLAVEAAKKRNNQKTYFYETSLSEAVTERRALEHALMSADLDKQFTLHYQAQLGINKRLHGAETLIRWEHPELGFISPGKFIPIAEEGRQILRLGHWILGKAFLQAKAWSKIQPNFNLSINISPIQFHEADFVAQIEDLLYETGVNPTNITLELTEGVLIADTESALQKIERLNMLELKVSIDDFGTGYSSLSYLQKLPIHELKIDQSFIFRVPDSKDDIAIVESIISLARTKNLLIVAEGVETEAQAEFLHQQPEEILIQGYLYSRPCPCDEFENSFLTLQ